MGNGCIDILGDHISTVEQAYRHVFACFGVAFDHLVVRFEARVGDLRHRHFFMIGFFSRNDRTESGEGKMNSRIGNQIGLKLIQIYV